MVFVSLVVTASAVNYLEKTLSPKYLLSVEYDVKVYSLTHWACVQHIFFLFCLVKLNLCK